MSGDSAAPTITVRETPPPPSVSPPAGGSSGNERPKPSLSSVASTANQILFKNELYTSMKQKTMDQELMARLNREAQDDEKRKFEKARVQLARLDTKQKILIGVGDMTGPPGCDPTRYSSSVILNISYRDTIRDVKKKLIQEALWTDESPDDFGLYNDSCEGPLKDATRIEAALTPSKPASAGRASGRTTMATGSKHQSAIRLPRPYAGVLWAARVM